MVSIHSVSTKILRVPDQLDCSHPFPAQSYISGSKETGKYTHFLCIPPPFTSHLKFRAYTMSAFKIRQFALLILLEGVQ